jgi:L-fucose isomerase-like protein
MSIMSNNLMPSACETDIGGVVGMYALTLASCKPSAIVDWNNNYADDPDKGVIFHCSNLPKDIFVDETIAVEDVPVMDYQAIIAGSVGKPTPTARSSGGSRRCPLPTAASRRTI